MQAEASKQKFLPPLTGIRGLTIMWMVIFHLHNILATFLPSLSGFAAVTIGVKFRMDLLFMLSGFLISYVYIANRGKLTRGAYASFLGSRLNRLYPVYVAVTVFLFFLNGITSESVRLAFRIGFLVILAGFLLGCVVLAKRVGAILRVGGDFLASFRIRLVPLLIVAAVTILGLVIVASRLPVLLGGHHDWTIIPVRLAMLQAWPWVPLDNRTFGSVWFLSSLWFAYLFFFPVAWRLVHRLRSTWAALLWVFVPVVVWLTVSQVASLKELRMVTRASCGFLCGSAIFALYSTRSAFIAAAQKYLDATVLLFLGVSILIPHMQSEAARLYLNFLLVLAAPFLLAGNTACLSFTSKFLATRPMLWLGTISYSLFMSHEIAIKLLDLALPSDRYTNSPLLVRVLAVAAYFGFILLAAAGLYYFVEAPWAASLKSFSAKRGPKTAPASPLTAAAAQNPSR